MSKDWMRDVLAVIVSCLIAVGIPIALILICVNGCVNGCHRFMEDAEKKHKEFEQDMMRAMDRKVKQSLEDNSEHARWYRFMHGDRNRVRDDKPSQSDP
ncbi:MAG: hypothetical protein IJI36_07395 [Kiritimatiellae bacterium]|nr:hypothetical protein [Kiritimatiellia bacterium]